MTTRQAFAPDDRRPLEADLDVVPTTLAGEHLLLLRDVSRRAAPVLALAAARTWPAEELHSLITFLQTVVLRQASDEEVQLFPNDSSAAPFAELSAAHVRLYELTAQLGRAAATPCSLPELLVLVELLLTVLERHLSQEQAVLASLPDAPADVPSAAGLVAGTQAWLPPGDDPVLILLDTLPDGHAVQLCIERLLRLRPGETAEIHSSEDADLRQVARWMHDFDSMRYGLAPVLTGPAQSWLQVTRRHLP